MKEMKCLVKLMYDELGDAQKYAELALKYKDSESYLADSFNKLSAQELEHFETLHAQAVRLVRDHAQTEPPKGMKEIWEWEHERMIEWKAQIRNIQDFYRK